jgi:hypothetical protein
LNRLSHESELNSRQFHSLEEEGRRESSVSFSGTPEELDPEQGSSLASYVGRESPASNQLPEAKAEKQAAAKAARDIRQAAMSRIKCLRRSHVQARVKPGQNAKKQEDDTPKEPTPESTRPLTRT